MTAIALMAATVVANSIEGAPSFEDQIRTMESIVGESVLDRLGPGRSGSSALDRTRAREYAGGGVRLSRAGRIVEVAFTDTPAKLEVALSEERSRELAERWGRACAPPGWRLRGTGASEPDARGEYAFDLVASSRPELRKGGPPVSVRVDRERGVVRNVRGVPDWTPAPDAADWDLVPLAAAESAALDVYRSRAPYAEANLTSEYVMMVPAFSAAARRSPATIVHEMTAEHLDQERRKEWIPLVEVVFAPPASTTGGRQTVWIDARNGQAVAWHRLDFALAGTLATTATEVLSADRWETRGVVGRLEPVSEATSPHGETILLRRDRRVVGGRFDPRAGLVRIGTQVYRPDAALLRAMRAQKAVRAFGKW